MGGFIIVIVLKYLTYKDGKKSICENKEIVEELKKNKGKLKELLRELELLEKETRKKEIEQYDLKSQKETIEHEIRSLNDLYEHKKKTVSESLKDIYDAYKISAEENLNRSLEEAALNYQKAREDYQKEYLNTLEETQKSFTDLIINRQEELEEVVRKLNEAKESYQALIKTSDNKYNIEDFTLQISPEDLVEIEKLREVIPYLKDAIDFENGIYIAEINKTSNLKNANIKSGDIITKIDNKELEKMSELRTYIYSKNPGDIVNLTIKRGKKEFVLKIKLGTKL